MAGQDTEKQDRTGAGELGISGLFAETGLFHRNAKSLVRAFYRALWGCRWRNASAVPLTGGALLVANHPSYLDPLGIYVGAPRRVFWMAWENLFRVPWMGNFIRRAGAFPVSGITADTRAFRTAGRLLREGHMVGIFPEGGRSLSTGEVFPFLANPFRLAVRLGCPVVPVTVNESWRVWSRDRPLPGIGGNIDILYHPPISPPQGSGGRKAGTARRAEALARRAREIILGDLRAPAEVLDRSRKTQVLDPRDHPIFRADRAGIPLLDWMRREQGRRGEV